MTGGGEQHAPESWPSSERPRGPCRAGFHGSFCRCIDVDERRKIKLGSIVVGTYRLDGCWRCRLAGRRRKRNKRRPRSGLASFFFPPRAVSQAGSGSPAEGGRRNAYQNSEAVPSDCFWNLPRRRDRGLAHYSQSVVASETLFRFTCSTAPNLSVRPLAYGPDIGRGHWSTPKITAYEL